MPTYRSLGATFCLALAALATPVLPSRAEAQQTLQASVPSVPAEAPERRDRNRLSEDEIKHSPQVNRDMLEVVRSTRPHWLRMRGDRSVASGGSIKVYIDGMLADGLDDLKRLDPSRVKSAQYLNASAATIQYGSDHTRGAILVFTR